MPVKAAKVPFDGVAWFSAFGFSMGRLKDGRIYVPEWVQEEDEVSAVAVHDDAGKDYIVKGDPTLGMLYPDAETLWNDNEDTFIERAKEELESAARWAKPSGKEVKENP